MDSVHCLDLRAWSEGKSFPVSPESPERVVAKAGPAATWLRELKSSLGSERGGGLVLHTPDLLETHRL